MDRPASRYRLVAALLGLVSGAVALAVGELVAGLLAGRSPLVSVGDAAIDRVPSWLKDLAIEWFGTNDKVALVAGILLVLGAVAAAIGVAYRRRAGRSGVTNAPHRRGR